MIVTLTANPSVDRTMVIDGPIKPGEVFRALSVGDEAGGKGVNVARAVAHHVGYGDMDGVIGLGLSKHPDVRLAQLRAAAVLGQNGLRMVRGVVERIDRRAWPQLCVQMRVQRVHGALRVQPARDA